MTQRSSLTHFLAVALLFAAAGPAAASPPPLTLAEALALAQSRNEDAAVATARLERAAASLDEAYATLLPALSLGGTYTRRAREVTRVVDGERFTIQARDALQGTATLTAPLFDAQALPLVRGARHQLAAQTFESRELRRALAYTVAESFYAVLSTERLAAAARRRTEVARATVEDARLRLDAGLAARNEQTRSELELASAELGETELASSVVNARLALGFLLAEPLDERALAAPEPTAGSGQETVTDAPRLTATAIAGREDLRALEARASAAREQALAPRLGWIPDLEMRGTYRRTNEEGLSGVDADWNLAAVLTWELFDGGTRYARARGFAAAQREAELAATAARRSIDFEVRRALADLATARATLRQASVGADVAEQNAEEVRERFRVGLATALEQADANVSAFEAVAGRERAALALAIAELDLQRALGRWPGDAPPADLPPPPATTPAAPPASPTQTPETPATSATAAAEPVR
jgi:outer membrane protein TolC